jgi:hypothetical protein
LRVLRKGWQGGTVPNCEAKSLESNSKCHLTAKFSQEAPGHEDRARIQNGPSFHWQVDTEGFIFAENKTLPARTVAPPTWKRLATNAHENSSQSRIDGINREARDESEGHCGRVFLDPIGKDDHRST